MTDEDQNTEPIKITSLTIYLEEVSKISEEILKSGDKKRIFFRGQENIKWDVTPTVFRKSYLCNEAKMANEAFARNPPEFRDHILPFERLTKLQHYGLCTRLLDVTLNPMVALYFACQKCDETEIITDDEGNSKEQKVRGVVYYQVDYGNDFNSPEVRTLSAISVMDMEDMTLDSCLEILQENGTLLNNHVIAYKKNDFREFIKVLQENLFVIPNFSNERLIRQNGAFLLPGCINIIKSEDNIGESRIQKAKDNLRNEFTSRKFVIPVEEKDTILEELDLYNINEASLFPELEHQMGYIKSIHTNSKPGFIDIFSKIKWDIPVKDSDAEQAISLSLKSYDSNEVKAIIRSKIDENIPDNISVEEIYKVFEKNLVVDWYKKNQVISTIRKEIKHVLGAKYSPMYSANWANLIVNMVIDAIINMNGESNNQ